MDEPHHASWNVNDHGGYSPKQLFISPKYSTFNEEITEYKYLSYKIYKKVIETKVKQYYTTNMVKTLKSCWFDDECIKLEYDIDPDSPIKFEHLLSLCLYTDLSDLCFDFSCSFRALNPYEPLSLIKDRNSKYYWFSRYLRECVQLYGESLPSDKPVYCGLSRIFYFPEFDIRLCSPSSTTYQIAVAIKFSGGKDGIVIKLKNEVRSHNVIMGFNTGWISAFKEESEGLYFGGHYMMRINSITIMETKKNYETSIKVLKEFNYMFNGEYIGKDCENGKLSSSELVLINGLLDYILFDDDKDKQKIYSSIDSYILNTFKLYSQNKMQILLDLEQLDMRGEKSLHDRIMYERELTEDIVLFCSSSSTNLFRGDIIFKLFPNLKSIIMIVVAEYDIYSFSFSFLLSIISKSSLEKVIIKTMSDEDNWLYSIWSSNDKKLKHMFSERNFNISFNKNKKRPDEEEEDDPWIVIERQ